MIYDANDIHSAALCAWKEARGESIGGMLAQLHCLRNRVGASGFAGTLHDVIYGKNQFTSMSVPSDPEFNLQPPSNSLSSTDSLMWGYAQQLAAFVFRGSSEPDIIDGAVWYADELNVTSGWYRTNIMEGSAHPIVIKIGRHTFRK